MSGENKGTVVADVLGGDIPPSLARFGEDRPKSTSLWLAALLPASLLVVALAATAGGFWLLRSQVSSWLAPAAFLAGSFFFISSAAVLLGIIRERRLETEEVEACEKDCRDLFWALNCIGDRTLKGLAWVNYRQLRVFTRIAQRQARLSYYASLAAASISLLVLTSGAAVAIGLPTTTAKVTAGTLATVGSVLSGFLVKTFLRSYQMASRQMSYYYGQPLVHCYLLHAQSLASKGREEFGNEEGRLLLQKVIDACIKAGADAQDHLLTMQEPGLGRRSAGSARRRGVPQKETPQPPPVPNSLGSFSRAS
jgi:hypothetical protein